MSDHRYITTGSHSSAVNILRSKTQDKPALRGSSNRAYRSAIIAALSYNLHMDAPYRHESADDAMTGVEDNMSTTPTGGYNNGYQPTSRRQSIQSPDHPTQSAPFSPNPDADPNARNGSHPCQQQPMQPYSRPSSGLSGSGDRYGHPQPYQDQNQRASNQVTSNQAQSSVVIKVGMVGDAQIGKTSLMVKYVEGSWDEDYIQTLGTNTISRCPIR